ncbi:MAG: response regulator [Myxococcales bacterium]|nr:response regulator [Myxococcales bacterium]
MSSEGSTIPDGEKWSEDSGVEWSEEARRAKRPHTGRKVIIVDDDRDTRALLQFILEQEGYVVSQAPSGLRLISLLHVDRPDLILLDVMMSWINGFELCRAIKSNPAFRGIPICFISARSDPSSLKEGIACGAADYFVKPLDVDNLVKRVSQLTSVH